MAFIFVLMGILCLACLLLMRFALPGFEKKSTLVVAGLGLFTIAARTPRFLASPLREQILTSTYYYVVLLPSTALFIAFFLALGTSPVWVFLGRWANRRSADKVPLSLPSVQGDPTANQTSSQPSRRQILTALAWSLPGLAVITASYGTLIESQSLTVRKLRLWVPNLPLSLEGFRIGQITDAHISHDFTLIKVLEAACEKLSSEHLDLLVTTGDLCDHKPNFAEVVNLLSQVKTRLGHYACLGNHEIYLGLDKVRQEHERSSLHLLENNHVTLGDLTICGISYPYRQNPRMEIQPDVATQFLNQALPIQTNTDENRFTLLLSHHPHVITQARQHNIDLMLSGHLHGGQIGLGQRSLLEPIYGYTRGLYQADNMLQPAKKTQLFVSNGMGHWLPFRVACPPEVVVVELSRNQSLQDIT